MKHCMHRVEGMSAKVFVGGAGEPLLLVHGGWGGAEMHWAPVWEPLAARFRVVAPDLPGIGDLAHAPLGSVCKYAQWLTGLMGALGAPTAWCVGNSFGASVVCELAAETPQRCLGLVLVNGFPMPPTPPPLRWLGERTIGRSLLRAIERHVAYTPDALARGFADPAKAPQELRALLQQPAPPQLEAMVGAMVQGGSASRPGVAPLLLWAKTITSRGRAPTTRAGSTRRGRDRR